MDARSSHPIDGKACVPNGAWCLMGNHYHLMVETPEANLSSGMRQLDGVYTQEFNRRHRRSGHVFQGRYKSIRVDKESYLLELIRYIVLNPAKPCQGRHGELPTGLALEQRSRHRRPG